MTFDTSTIAGIIGIVVAVPALAAFMFGRRSKSVAPAPVKAKQPIQSSPVVAASKPTGDLPPDAKRAAIKLALQDKSLTDADRQKLKELILAEARKESNVAVADDPLKMPTMPTIPAGAIPANGAHGRFRAIVFSETGEYNIDFKRVPVPIGAVVQLEPSMPSKGGHYMVTETVLPDGTAYWMPYDPRLQPLLSQETPQTAYEAVEWYREVNAVYANKYGIWEKVNVILGALFAVGLLLVALAAIDALSKR